jgi:peptide/nickel transport system substrate-binding protein
MTMKYIHIFAAVCLLFCFSCSRYDELSLEELEAMNTAGIAEILAKTVSKPWTGQNFIPGRLGGTWNSVTVEDPKTFNHLLAEYDGNSAAVMSSLTDFLLEYDVVTRQWVPRIASPQIITDEANDKLTVLYTLRDDLYWSYYNSDRKVKVTSDDVIFWYNEISGDKECQSSGYYQQYMIMADGITEKHIDIEKIDDLRFAFHFPRIIAEPLISTNMDFGPRHIYEPAKKAGGAEGVRKLDDVSTDPRTIPSMGEWFIVEYTPGQRIVYKRNPNYWRKDERGVSLPYIEERIARIVPEENTQMLLFKDGSIEAYVLRPEDLDGIVNKNDGSYTVFNSEGALSSWFWMFNQNPVNSKKPQYEWFSQKEFRQAMSCLLNRDRINAQVYRGLAQPKVNIFPETNPYYNPSITNQYLYDQERALDLLYSVGFKKDFFGNLRDSKNRRVEFNLSIRTDSSMIQDIASIIRDELSKVGIKLNIRIIDFQKLVEQLQSTYDWDSMIMGLSGNNTFPSQGSNVWPSSGNLHMWYPNQERPVTEWEARIDWLYNEGQYTLDAQKAQKIWDEFQSILLEQLPMIHLMRSRQFFALNNRWDQTNVYYDNKNGAETSYIYLK